MALHFSVAEYQSRQAAACRSLEENGYAGILLFRQESMYYLTGYDTFGYCFFQCLFLHADGRMTLLARAPELRQARHTSTLEDIRVWVDQDGLNPAQEVKNILQEYACQGQRLAVEYDAYGLTAANGKLLDAALHNFCELEDASGLISRLRLIKSPAELEYIHKAAVLADAALDAGVEATTANAFEGDILAAMHNAIFKGGGDYPGNEFIIGAGEDALLCRYFSGRKNLASKDQLTLEFAGVYRHYHACLMRTILIGEVSQAHKQMHAACVDAMQACRETLRPDLAIGAVFDAHARVLDAAGYRHHRLNACGYSLGATFTPTWMDWPMFYTGNPVIAQENMVFFIHIILADSDNNRAMTLGHTVRITANGNERLSKRSLELICK